MRSVRAVAAMVAAIVLSAAFSAVAHATTTVDPNFQTLAIFSGAGYASPTGSLVMSGNMLYGSMSTGVFAYNTATRALSVVPVSNPSSLAVDGSGDVYGVDGNYAIFKIAHGASTASTVQTFSVATAPSHLLVAPGGTIYGQTNSLGASPALFSLSTGGTFTTYPAAGAFASPSFIDGQGNVVGASVTGGSAGAGSIFKVNPATGNVTTTVQFTGTSGYYPSQLVADAAGNYYGLASGTANNTGLPNIFEVPAGTSTPITKATAIGDNGTDAYGLLADPNGDLFIVTNDGGIWDAGALLGVNAGSSSVATLGSFLWQDDPSKINTLRYNGVDPLALVQDASGDLFGVTAGANNLAVGNLFEVSGLAAGAGAPVPEPASVALLVLGGMLLCSRQRRQV